MSKKTSFINSNQLPDHIIEEIEQIAKNISNVVFEESENGTNQTVLFAAINLAFAQLITAFSDSQQELEKRLKICSECLNINAKNFFKQKQND